MKIAIMQPYFFPYIGYWQLIDAVDRFVMYDNVNYINRGWINRNRILVNGKPTYITIPVSKASQNKLISDLYLDNSTEWRGKMLKTIYLAYHRAPQFENVFPLIEAIIFNRENRLSNFLKNSITLVTQYLGINTEIKSSSEIIIDNNLKGEDKIVSLCKSEGANVYVNAIGGQGLYSKEKFSLNNINLNFIKSKDIEYHQFDNEFLPWLSIVDVLMFNSVEHVKNQLLNEYELI